MPFHVAMAQSVEADPVSAVAEEVLEDVSVPVGSAPVLLELFSTQACFFCPQAERLFADLIKQENVIGLSCHVDYFDVKQNALSHDFCTVRQKNYMEKLKAGPQYTPQVVVDGRVDVIGHKFAAIQKAMAHTAQTSPKLFDVRSSGNKEFIIALPAVDNIQVNAVDLWLMLYDKPHELTVAEGRNRGKKVAFFNIVSDMKSLGRWDGTAQDKALSPALQEKHRGFVVIAQDHQSGAVIGMGRYQKKSK